MSQRKLLFAEMEGYLLQILVKSLKKGLLESGADVIDIGLGPSPMLYYAANHLKSDGAIMVTGSHNPSNHNGFKIMKGTVPFFW